MKNKTMLITLLILTIIAACNNGKATGAKAEAVAAVEDDVYSMVITANTSVRIDSLNVNTVKDTTIAKATLTILYDRGGYMDRFEQERTYRLERNHEAKGKEPKWNLVALEKGVPKYKERITTQK